MLDPLEEQYSNIPFLSTFNQGNKLSLKHNLLWHNGPTTLPVNVDLKSCCLTLRQLFKIWDFWPKEPPISCLSRLPNIITTRWCVGQPCGYLGIKIPPRPGPSFLYIFIVIPKNPAWLESSARHCYVNLWTPKVDLDHYNTVNSFGFNWMQMLDPKNTINSILLDYEVLSLNLICCKR